MVDLLAEVTGSLGAVGYGLAAMGPGIGVGIVFAAYIQASARQPESAAANRTWLIMVFAGVDAIEGGIKRAEEAQAEANKVLEQYRQQLAEARTEAARIRDEARADAVAIREDLLAKAAEERDRIIAAGEERLAAQRATIVRELRADLGSLAVELAGRIVGDSLIDEARQRGTIERFLGELGGPEPAGTSAASGRSEAESAVKRPGPDSSGRR